MPVKTPPEYVVVEGDPSSRGTRAAAVQNAIDSASANGVGTVFLPEPFFDYDASAVSFDDQVRVVREGSESNGWDWMAYGAHPDAPDNGPAIQAAIDQCEAAGGGTSWGPAGVYRIEQTLLVPVGNSVRLVGEGQVATVIEKTTATSLSGPDREARNGSVSDAYDVDAVLAVDHENNEFRNQIEVRHLTLRGRGQGQTGYGIYAPRLKRTVFENVHVEEVATGFLSYQLFQTRLSSVRFEHVADGFLVRDDGSGLGASTSLLLENCYVNHASEFGYDLFGLSYSQVVACAADDINQDGTTGGTAYRLRSCRGLHLMNSGCEDSRVHVVWATNSRATVAGFRTQNIDGVAAGTTGYLRWENGHYTVIDSRFDPFRSPSQSFNEIVQNGAHLVCVNTQRPTGGRGFISYGGGSTRVQVREGRFDFTPDNAGMLRLPRFTDGERPAAGEAGRVIYNLDDENLNIDDGSNWILPDGTAT